MVRIENVSFWYEKQSGIASLHNINLNIRKGEVVVLCGKSGCGKTTITRLINGLIPHFYEGKLEGTVWINDLEIPKVSLSKISEYVGSVFQNPRSQFFNVDTTSELAFECENQGIDRSHILARVNEARDVFHLKRLMDRDIFELSGGEKQQIACGSVYATNPEVIVLDEPSSNLDMGAVFRLKEIISELKRQNKTIIISEHRLHYLMDSADRFIYVDNGEIQKEFSNMEFRKLSLKQLKSMGLRCTDLKEVKRTSIQYQKGDDTPAICVKNLSCRRNGTTILSVPSLEIPKGSVIALIGGNGVGKSTLAESLCGVLNCTGEVAFDGKPLKSKERAQISYMVMQDVNHQLFCESVREEIAMNTPSDVTDRVELLLDKMGLSDFAERHPGSLSGGQKQRVAICSALCADKKAIFYDEPTSGLDYDGMERLCNLIGTSKENLLTSVVITHDLELILGCCTHVLELKNGKVLALYALDNEGEQRVKEFFIKKEGTRMEDNQKPSSRPVGLGRLVQLAFTKKAYMIPSTILSALAAVASFIPYLCIYWIVEVVTQVYPNFDIASGAAIMRYGVIAFIGVALNILLYYFALLFSHLAAFGTSYQLKIEFASHLAKLPLGFLLNYGSGRLRKITDNNIGKAEDFISHQFPDLVSAIAAPIAMLVILFTVDWRYGIVSLISIIIAYVVQMSSFGGASVQKLMKEGQAVQENMNNASVEYVRGITVVKAFHQTVYSFKKLYTSIKDYTNFIIPYNLKFENSNSLYTALVNNIYLFLIPVMILIGINTPADEYGDFASNAIFYLVFVPAISSVMTKVMFSSSNCMQVSSCVERMDEILDSSPLPESDVSKHCEGGEVQFKHVSFTYDEGQNIKALDDVTFNAPEGKVTAIVGPSGGGKSTIANLIPRFYDVSEGAITIGNVDIRDISPEELTHLVSIVFQDVFLFKQSILENIRMGRPEATRDEIIAAAKAAQCDEFISKLPQGYDTIYGKAGVYLSGGEKQRVSIARAIVKNAPVLVLDEATAFSDPENEHLIQQALTELMNGKTVIMIAHRLSTVKSADNILVMDHGRLVEQGNHDNLLKQNGKYKQMWDTYTQALSWKMEQEVSNRA